MLRGVCEEFEQNGLLFKIEPILSRLRFVKMINKRISMYVCVHLIPVFKLLEIIKVKALFVILLSLLASINFTYYLNHTNFQLFVEP